MDTKSQRILNIYEAGVSEAELAENLKTKINASTGGPLGSIKPTDAAPTPARNGNYTFSIGGNKPAWLTAEPLVTEVKAGDGVAVVYEAPSTYSYTHVDIEGDFLSEKSTHEFAICDAENKNIITFDNGHFKTKNFDSSVEKVKLEAVNLRLNDIEKIPVTNKTEIPINWELTHYLKEDGSTGISSSIPETMTSGFIPYYDGLMIEGGFVRLAQGNILACLYNSNYVKIGSIYPPQSVLDEAQNTNEVWLNINVSDSNLDDGYSISNVSFMRIQGNSSFNTKLFSNVEFDKLANSYLSSDSANKSIAIFGGSFSMIETGAVCRAIFRYYLNSYVRTFGQGGAGFGYKSSWYKGYPNSPILDGEGHVQWEQSIPNQIDLAISYCVDNNILNGFDYWILWASTNDFNTHIKNKGLTTYSISDLEDKSQYGNADTQNGGIILSIQKIKSAYPNAKILFFGSLPFFSAQYGYNLLDTTLPSSNVIQTDGSYVTRVQENTYKEFIEDQKKICERYHIPYLDQMSIANVNDFNYTSYYNPADNYLHPLRQAYRMWAMFQLKFISNY